jgi:hypothetical protein
MTVLVFIRVHAAQNAATRAGAIYSSKRQADEPYMKLPVAAIRPKSKKFHVL